MNKTCQGATADGNAVIIQNSEIGLIPDDSNSNDANKQSLNGTNIYGALAYETASKNVVVISDSTILGNVQGAVSFLDDVLFDKTDYHPSLAP